MIAAVSKLLVLLAALLLALPAGVCCGAADVPAAATKPSACCKHGQQPSSEHPGRAPTLPASNCCCLAKAATATASVKALDSSNATGFWSVAAWNSFFAADSAIAAVPVVSWAGPAVRVLLCVWRI